MHVCMKEAEWYTIHTHAGERGWVICESIPACITDSGVSACTTATTACWKSIKFAMIWHFVLCTAKTDHFLKS